MTNPELIRVLAEEAHGAFPVVAPAPAEGVFGLLWLVIALPALGAAILLIGGRRTDGWGHWLGLAMSTASFLVSAVLFGALVGQPAGERQFSQTLWTWFTAGDWTVQMTLLYDQLSSLFLLLITGVGSLIHLYSVGYMEHDERRRRFFGYLNLFVAAMLVLVLAGDYVGVFLGWEGVGLASYLLIGFWQQKDSAAVAAKKAFVVNRVGDIGMVLAVGLLLATFGSTEFAAVSKVSAEAPQWALTGIGLLLLLAACGKSAQFPLQSWLLDAMEGPTPVSALIHAATMVTAGVYLITRSNFIFDHSSFAQGAVVAIGTITLLMGAVIGCAKDDIKKALAGSTMSQIGYMILAAGLGTAGYAFAIFHLLTHGFFKANMFLGAGSVMHGMNDDVNMRHYGNLREHMKVTFATFAMGYLAIIGFPFFSGFFSKDKIIETALLTSPVAGFLALAGAVITGFYMTRLMLMTFFGDDSRWDRDVHPHESPKVMTIPLMVLAFLSVVGGALLLFIGDWLAPVVGTPHEHHLPVPAWVISLGVVALVAVGVWFAWTRYGKAEIPREAPTQVSFATRAARADLYGDAFNEAVLMRPGDQLVKGLTTFDETVVDGAAEGTAASFSGAAGALRLLQSGYVRSYALSVLGGAALVVLALLVVNS